MIRKILLFAVLFSCAALRVQADSCLSSRDREIVAACMVLEAGGEGTDGMRAVLNVILNRAKGDLSRLAPITVKRGAFSCMASIWDNDAPDYSPLFERVMSQTDAYAKASQLIAAMEMGLLTDNTGGATHYHANSVQPYWVSDMRYLTTIGNHIFYVERGSQVALL
ncbi:MAG TPA: cell wall hydrolase [Pontiellaceae bacterium]|nr:cell wall hydrolase [Pontiellaceae bacterium]HPR82889.1 cell wall hydrolase [Pontiellaceae bacterium]